MRFQVAVQGAIARVSIIDGDTVFGSLAGAGLHADTRTGAATVVFGAGTVVVTDCSVGLGCRFTAAVVGIADFRCAGRIVVGAGDNRCRADLATPRPKPFVAIEGSIAFVAVFKRGAFSICAALARLCGARCARAVLTGVTDCAGVTIFARQPLIAGLHLARAGRWHARIHCADRIVVLGAGDDGLWIQDTLLFLDVADKGAVTTVLVFLKLTVFCLFTAPYGRFYSWRSDCAHILVCF